MIKAFTNDFDFLSNFYPSEIRILSKIFPTVEHAYQAVKTTEEDWIDKIRHAPTPGKAKRLGRKAPLRRDWEFIRLSAMQMLLEAKFADPKLSARLVDTGTQDLIEKNYWHDNYWGVCTCTKCAHGFNHLGKLLMSIRLQNQIRNKSIRAIKPSLLSILI